MPVCPACESKWRRWSRRRWRRNKSGERIELFNAFNLELAAGEVKVLMGPSGSGKTTLLKMLCGLEQPDGGTIDYDGQDLYAMSDEARRTFRRASIGFADQAACLLPQLTALENVLLPAIGEREDHRETAQKWLARFGLEKRQDFFPAQLSGGERQRVALARALLAVLLATHNTRALDFFPTLIPLTEP